MSDFVLIPTLAGVKLFYLLIYFFSLIFVCPGSFLLSSLGCSCGEQGPLSGGAAPASPRRGLS